MSDAKEFGNETQLTEEQKTQLDLMESTDTPTKEISFGSEVTGKVVSISDDSVFVDIALRNEAILSKAEVLDEEGNCTVSVGDSLKLYVISESDDEVYVSKSLKKGKANKQLLRLIQEKQLPVEGRVTGVNKGGFNVTILGKRAFCPFSAIDITFPQNPADFMGKEYEFVISKLENRGNNIVLSRLPLLSGNIEEKLEELEKSLENDEPVTGVVTRLTNFGAFVDFGGIEGLIHVSEITWDRDENVSEVLTQGEKVTVKILSIEKADTIKDTRISLSLKRLSKDPWIDEVTKLNVGDKVKATVSRLVNFGAFVKLLPGVEGLLRTEDMAWGRVRKPSDVVKKGDEITVTITNIDLENRKIDLSLKDADQDPWADAAEKFAEGNVVEGRVADSKEYGYFVDLNEFITGLLPKRRVAKDKEGSIKKGDTIEVTVEQLDLDNRKIALAYGEVGEDTSRRSNKKSGGSNSDAVKYMKQQEKNAKNAESDFAFLLKNALKK